MFPLQDKHNHFLCLVLGTKISEISILPLRFRCTSIFLVLNRLQLHSASTLGLHTLSSVLSKVIMRSCFARLISILSGLLNFNERCIRYEAFSLTCLTTGNILIRLPSTQMAHSSPADDRWTTHALLYRCLGSIVRSSRGLSTPFLSATLLAYSA